MDKFLEESIPYLTNYLKNNEELINLGTDLEKNDITQKHSEICTMT